MIKAFSPMSKCCCVPTRPLVRSIAVRRTLEGSFNFHTNVIRLLLRQGSQLSTQCWKVKPGDLLVQLFGEQIHVVLVGLCFFPVLEQIELRECLIGEGARHDKRWMPCGTAKIEQPA